MTTADHQRFQDLSRRLAQELDGASAGLRTTAEWKGARAVLDGFAGSGPGEDEAEALDDANRLLGAQLDLLGLARERTELEDQRVAAGREDRLREDKRIVEQIEKEMQLYGWLVLGSLLLAPALGIPWGPVVLLAAIPAVMGTTRMMRAKRPTAGRTWVILQGDVDELLGRVRIYEIGAAVAIATPVVWLIIRAMIVG